MFYGLLALLWFLEKLLLAGSCWPLCSISEYVNSNRKQQGRAQLEKFSRSKLADIALL